MRQARCYAHLQYDHLRLRPCRALLMRSSFNSSSLSTCSHIHAAVPSAWPRMTPAYASLRLAPARTSCTPWTAKRRSAPVLVIGMPLKCSRSSR
eukprot:6200502-Pleurochrysis_carterae.AAC.1